MAGYVVGKTSTSPVPAFGQVAKEPNGNPEVSPQGLAESPMDTSSSMALLLMAIAALT